MANLAETNIATTNTDSGGIPAVRPAALVQEYLLERMPIYRELHSLRTQAGSELLF
jgi:hypothetical protein